MQIQECTGQTRTPQQGSRQLHHTTRRFGIGKPYRKLRTSRMNCIISDRHAWRGSKNAAQMLHAPFATRTHSRQSPKARDLNSAIKTHAAKHRHTRPRYCRKTSQRLHDSLVLIGSERKKTNEVCKFKNAPARHVHLSKAPAKCIVPREDSE